MKKHTPGPWKALGLLCPWGWVIKYDNKKGKEAIAYIQAYDIESNDPEPYGEWDEESQANHNLVLAAPDLLAALRKCVVQLDMISGKVHDERQALIDAHAAIAKATGEQS